MDRKWLIIAIGALIGLKALADRAGAGTGNGNGEPPPLANGGNGDMSETPPQSCPRYAFQLDYPPHCPPGFRPVTEKDERGCPKPSCAPIERTPEPTAEERAQMILEACKGRVCTQAATKINVMVGDVVRPYTCNNGCVECCAARDFLNGAISKGFFKSILARPGRSAILDLRRFKIEPGGGT